MASQAIKMVLTPLLLLHDKPANSPPFVVDVEPGTQFRYSGGGTTLAQLILQDQTKCTLTELAKTNILSL
jgi:CubicO group peptidase (beta-lactamase class C family)